MKLTNVIGNTQQQGVQFWMASCLAKTLSGFVCAYFAKLAFSAGNTTLTCGYENKAFLAKAKQLAIIHHFTFVPLHHFTVLTFCTFV